MLKPARRKLLLFILPLSLTSCVFDDDWTSEPSANQTEHFTYHSVEDIEVKSGIEGDFDGFMVHAGSVDLNSSQSSSDLQNRAGEVESSSRDMVGFISERPALDSGDSALAVANSLIQKLTGTRASVDEVLNRLFDISTISEQTFAGLGAISKRVTLSFSGEVGPTPTMLALSLAELFGVNKDNGSVSNWPSEDSDEARSTQYILYLTVVYVNQQQIVVMASVIPNEVSDGYTHLLRSSTTPTNVTLNGLEIDSESQDYTAVGGGGLADFLFVIDDSGSMSSSQAAVRNAASVFSDSMQSSGLDFQIATITTSTVVEFRDTLQNGAFTNDLEEYKNDVTPGTGGSSTERGIYNAERSLLSTALGDQEDGIVTQAGHPRSNAGLSVIIISDEPSQYPSPGFNPDQNLFIERGYRVYSIVKTTQNDVSQYDDLANSSGGNVADIDNTDNFPEIFQEIAILAGAASSRYNLEYTPIESSITVETNGKTQPRSNSNGWQYVIGSNAILFRGESIPSKDSKVEISYNHLPVQTWWVEPSASSIDAKFK